MGTAATQPLHLQPVSSGQGDQTDSPQNNSIQGKAPAMLPKGDMGHFPGREDTQGRC